MAIENWKQLDDAVLLAATTAGLTPEQVSTKTYAEICSLAKVNPKQLTFPIFYEDVRRRVASRMKKANDEAADEAVRKDLEDAVRSAAKFLAVEVKIDPDRRIVVEKVDLSNSLEVSK